HPNHQNHSQSHRQPRADDPASPCDKKTSHCRRRCPKGQTHADTTSQTEARLFFQYSGRWLPESAIASRGHHLNWGREERGSSWNPCCQALLLVGWLGSRG